MEMVLVMRMMVMMISMMPDGDDDEDDFPLPEEFSLAESARQKGLFIAGGFRLGAAAELLI